MGRREQAGTDGAGADNGDHGGVGAGGVGAGGYLYGVGAGGVYPDGVGVAVVDIDGVVADVRHRLHHLRRRPARWDRFFAAAAEDPVLEVGADVVRVLAAVHTVVWLSGRPEELRAVTEHWLDGHNLPAGRLLLRPSGDYRPAAQLKLEVVRRLAQSTQVTAVLDDDPVVVAALRAAGFPALLADWVPREQILTQAQEQDGRT